jgi:hypothetical protein
VIWSVRVQCTVRDSLGQFGTVWGAVVLSYMMAGRFGGFGGRDGEWSMWCSLIAQPICLSANCIRVAADILDSLNTTADPCHDFYEFAGKSCDRGSSCILPVAATQPLNMLTNTASRRLGRLQRDPSRQGDLLVLQRGCGPQQGALARAQVVQSNLPCFLSLEPFATPRAVRCV